MFEEILLEAEKVCNISKIDFRGNYDSTINECVIESLVAFLESSHVTEIDLGSCFIRSEKASILFNSLKNNNTVTHLHLSRNNLDYKCLDSLVKMIEYNKNITNLDISYNLGITDECEDMQLFKALSLNTSITTLNLKETNIFDNIEPLTYLISHNNTITSLNISNNEINTNNIKLLSEAIKQNNSITTLEISGVFFPFFSERGLVYLLETLKHDTKISNLDISCNIIRKFAISCLAKLLSENKTITSINLSDNKISPKVMEILVNPLIKNTCIKTLDLSDNNLGFLGACAIAKVLRYNNTITDLNINNCKIEFEGLREIASALRYNNNSSSISKLNLSYNNINTDDPSSFLFFCLLTNKTITSLDLSDCHLANSALHSISKFLPCNTTLLKLDLGNLEQVKKDENIVYKLIYALQANKTLTSVSFFLHYVPQKCALYLLETLKTNKTLKSLSFALETIEKDVLKSLVELLEINMSLINLRIYGCDLLEPENTFKDKCLYINKLYQEIKSKNGPYNPEQRDDLYKIKEMFRLVKTNCLSSEAYSVRKKIEDTGNKKNQKLEAEKKVLHLITDSYFDKELPNSNEAEKAQTSFIELMKKLKAYGSKVSDAKIGDYVLKNICDFFSIENAKEFIKATATSILNANKSNDNIENTNNNLNSDNNLDLDDNLNIEDIRYNIPGDNGFLDFLDLVDVQMATYGSIHK